MNTKAFAFALAISTAGTTALADAHFTFSDYLTPSSILEFGVIQTDEAAVLEVYDFIGGQKGDLLGTVDLHAGANPDVRVNVGVAPRQDVLAMIKTGDHVTAVRHFHVHE